MIEGAHHAFHHVVDIGEVAGVVAMTEDLDRRPFEHGLGEEEERHIGTPPGPVDSEEAQARDGKPKQMGVGVGHQLIRLLGRTVKAHRMVDIVADAEGQLAVGAVDGARRGVDEVLDAVMAAAFEHIQESHDIGIEIRMGVVEGVTDASLRRHMHHPLGPLLGEGRLDDRSIGEVGLDELETAMLLEPRQPRLFQRHVVIGIEIVEANHLVAAIEQPRRRVIAYEAGGAGDQNSHIVAWLPLPVVGSKSAATKDAASPPVNCGGGGQVTRQDTRLTLEGTLAIEHGNNPT